MILIMIVASHRNFLLVYAFLSALLFNSCRENPKQDEKENTKENTNSDKVVVTDSTKVILFFGNSLTAGMGLEQTEAFPAQIQQKIDSLDLPYEVVNAGLSGETTAAGRNRINWVLNQKVDVFVLELGANDGLRGIPLEETKENLQAIINTVREKNPDTEIILAGMQIPPNLGQNYTSDFGKIFPDLAKENDLHLIPFLLEGVAGDPSLNQSDGIHPTAEGYEIVAENVWQILKPVLKHQ